MTSVIREWNANCLWHVFIVKCNARNSDNKANTGDRQVQNILHDQQGGLSPQLNHK